MKSEYLNHMGDDLTVVNAARCSFSAESKELTKRDHGLIKFLARGCMSGDWDSAVDAVTTGTQDDHQAQRILKWAKNMPTHWTPFSHAIISMRETVPIFVARQRFKHMIGFTYNEVSRRYVDDTPDFHLPEVWRARPEGGIKQGSGDEEITEYETPYGAYSVADTYTDFVENAKQLYEQLIESGVAPEQARMVLPQSMLTTYWVTGSLYAWANAYIQRSDSHAQKEIQDLAKQWDEIIRPLYPVSWSALVD